jgi:hypothetical protein
MRPIDADEVDFSRSSNPHKALDATPTLDVVPREHGELGRAINYLKDLYEQAKTQEWVKVPLVYALYYTWKHFDRRK